MDAPFQGCLPYLMHWGILFYFIFPMIIGGYVAYHKEKKKPKKKVGHFE